jgi:hypothetical protein
MTLKAFKVATQSQWTGPIIDIEEHCFGVVHPITMQTIPQYKKLQHDPHLKDLWVPAFSKEVHAEIFEDPYPKKSPLPHIGTIPHLPVSLSIPSHRILGQSRVLNRILLPYSLSRLAPTE